MKYILILLIFLNAANSLACSCILPQDFKNHEDLQPYSFIALVEIKKLPPRSAVSYGRRTDSIRIEVKELFKGKSISTVFDDAFNSSCALSLSEGEQWLFFGTANANNDKVFVGTCGYSTRYRDVDGKREWAYFTGIKQLNVLRQLFNPSDLNLDNKIYYPNGKTEIEQSFTNNKLDGIRKIYYPSGKLYIEEKFKNGYRADYRKIYDESGQLIKHVLYKGSLIEKITTYQDTVFVIDQFTSRAKYPNFPFLQPISTPEIIKKTVDSLRKTINPSLIGLIQVFKDDGKSYSREYYYPNGKLKYKSYLDWDKKLRETTNYREDGTLEEYTKEDFNNDQSILQKYQLDGTRKEYVSRCEFCSIYFNGDKQAEALPENIYIQ